MRVAVCDDDERQLGITKTALEQAYKSLDLLIDVYQDGNELLNRIEHIFYDLVILDIEMPGMNGIETGKRLRAVADKTAIVFLTSHIEYALEGYEVNALRYLMKPVSVEKLSEIICYLLERQKKERKLLLKQGDETTTVSVLDILYMEAQNQNIRVVTSSGEYLNRYNLSDYEKELAEYGFFRIHRGYLVNLGHVKRILGKETVMSDGAHLPVSRNKERAFKESLHRYIREEAI